MKEESAQIISDLLWEIKNKRSIFETHKSHQKYADGTECSEITLSINFYRKNKKGDQENIQTWTNVPIKLHREVIVECMAKQIKNEEEELNALVNKMEVL